MKRFILISLLSVVAAFALILPVSVSGGAGASVLRISLGGACLILPQAIWLWAADYTASKASQRPPSNFIRGLVIFFVFAFALTYGVLLASPLPGNNSIIMYLGNILFPAAFVALFTSIILVSRRVIDAEDNPQVARGSRIFVLCLCFFYAIIGMFFLAPRLKKLKAKAEL
ncbi:MAG: hypothetical protein ABJO36_01380 [Litorimonas sp.]